MFSRSLLLFVGALTPSQDAIAFAPSPNTQTTSITALHATSNRRAFVETVVASTLIASLPAFADEGSVGDLSMPTPTESKDEDAAMAERLRKKAELKKKAARPASYLDSLKGEQEKKKELQKSKEERRNALCEELGRGC